MYGMYGIPSARVMGRFGRSTGYVASDANADFPAAALASPVGGSGVETTNCVYNGVSECFHRTPIYINRNTYVLGIGTDRPEAPIYSDSDSKLEQGRRSFRVVPTLTQAHGGESFYSPSKTSTGSKSSGYPGDYRGPRWENITIPVASGSNYAQFVQQTQASYGVRWNLQQVMPNFKNQPFWIEGRKSASVSPDPSANVQKDADMQIDDPSSGSYFAVVLGGSGHGFGKMDRNNSYTLVFPIGGAAYMIDNNMWAKKRGEIRQFKDSEYKKAIGESVIAQSNSGVSLSDQDREFTITVMVVNNRINISTSWGDTIIVPSATYAVFNVDFSKDTQNKLNADKYANSSPTGFAIPSLPIEIKGRGFQCAVNFNPMEFGREDAVLHLPPITVTLDQQISPYFGKGGGFPSSYNTSSGVDESPLCLPSGDLSLTGGRGYGYDLGADGVTSMGLPSDSIDIVRVGPVMSANNFFGKLGGGAQTLDNQNELAEWMQVARYSVVLKGNANAEGGKGYSSKCSSAYKTPFWTRVLWRVSTIFESEGSGFDLTPYVKSISFSDSQESKIFFKRTATLVLRMPKVTETRYGNASRTSPQGAGSGFSFAKLQRSACIIKVWMHNGSQDSAGWAAPGPGSVNNSSGYLEGGCYYTGIALGGGKSESRQDDTLTLQIKDMTEVLTGSVILNSPFFDGMSLMSAVGHLLERGGISALNSSGGATGSTSKFKVTDRARQAGISKYRLPDSGRFTNPLMTVPQGKNPYDGIKKFCQIFKACFYCDNLGRYTLDVLEGTVDGGGLAEFRETNDLLPKMTFSTHPGHQGTDMYAWLLETKTTTPDFQNWMNIFTVHTMDIFSGAHITVVDGDLDSIVNPASDNFLGFPRATYLANGAFGGAEEALKFIATQKKILSMPITKVDIRVIGNSELRIMDIIRIDNNNFRIIQLSSELSVGPPKWMMNISAEHLGTWEEDVNPSERVFSDN